MIQVPFGNTLVSRIAPLAGPAAYKTYSMTMPARTHWRPATCEEVLCMAFLNGFATTVDTSTELGRKQYHFITRDRERSPKAEKAGETLVTFTFPPGTPCFARRDHKVALERPAHFLVTGGDFRGNPTGMRRRHANGAEWAEDCAEHLDRVNTERNRG
jgi:hypothetical protein